MRNIIMVFMFLFSIFFSAGCNNSEDPSVLSSLSSISPVKTLMDVHGAGAQRSDPKSGNPDSYAGGHGPQGDVVRIYNFVRLVRGCSLTSVNYQIIDTGQTNFYNNMNKLASAPLTGEEFYGQDAQYSGLQPSYTDNGDGTVTDNNTGLSWIKDCGTKKTYEAAIAGAASCTTGGHNDWRLPTVKELYSLIIFSGLDPRPEDIAGVKPFIDTSVFIFKYGDTSAGERIIDAQYLTSTPNVSKETMGSGGLIFGVNFADGRIKSYPVGIVAGKTSAYYVKYVRGNVNYGKNIYSASSGIVSDSATGLEWDQDDSGTALNWSEALAWVRSKNAASYKGHTDWRMPDAKELQSIVDYTRSPSTSKSPAIDPIFHSTEIVDEGGKFNYPYYWTGTTHAGSDGTGGSAVYISFGEALGYMTIK